MTHDHVDPITDDENAAAVAAVVDGHDRPPPELIRPPIRWFTADRRAVIAVCISGATSALVSFVVIVVLIRIIFTQGDTIDLERNRNAQAERQVAALQSQVSDQQNQTLCRAQIANDFESVRAQLERNISRRDQAFREALSAAASSDLPTFRAKLDEAASYDPAIATLEPAVDAAVAARQESVATCQKTSALTTTTTAPNPPGR